MEQDQYSISQLTEDTSAHDTDLIEVAKDNGNGTFSSRKQTRSTLLAGKADQTQLDDHVTSTSNPHNVTKAQVGLGNVENTSDLSKPISTATQTALNAKANASHTHAIADTTGLQAALDAKADDADLHIHTNKSVLDATTASFTTADETKLDGIATGATANSSDATLLNRTNHTGTQAISTVSGLQTALDGKASSGHTHDDRYYTEDETDALLNTKADTGDIPTLPATIVESVVAGTNVTIDNSDPANPVISSTGGGGGGGAVDSVNGQTGVVVLDADAIDDTSTDHKFTSLSEISKLAGIEAGAQVNEVSAADISDFETTTQLDARDTANRSRANHTGEQAISTVTGLQAALDGKASTSHSHAISDTAGLQAALDGKASTSHNHDAAYAPLEHDHAVADVTGLQTALDTKADESSLATVATSGSYNDLSDKPSIPTVPATLVESVVAGSNVTIDDADPAHPVISASGGGGGTTLPDQTGNAGKFLTTDGSALSWDTPTGGGGGGSTPHTQLFDFSQRLSMSNNYGATAGTFSTNINTGWVRATQGGGATSYIGVVPYPAWSFGWSGAGFKNLTGSFFGYSNNSGSDTGNMRLSWFHSGTASSTWGANTYHQISLYETIAASSSITQSSVGNGTSGTNTALDSSNLHRSPRLITFKQPSTGGDVSFYVDGVLKNTHTTNQPSIPANTSFGCIQATSFGAGTHIQMNMGNWGLQGDLY